MNGLRTYETQGTTGRELSAHDADLSFQGSRSSVAISLECASDSSNPRSSVADRWLVSATAGRCAKSLRNAAPRNAVTCHAEPAQPSVDVSAVDFFIPSH